MTQVRTTYCDGCGRRIRLSPSRAGRRKRHYCNWACYVEARRARLDCTCETCGKEFRGRKGNANRFCSRTCMNKQRALPQMTAEQQRYAEQAVPQITAYLRGRFRPPDEDAISAAILAVSRRIATGCLDIGILCRAAGYAYLTAYRTDTLIGLPRGAYERGERIQIVGLDDE